MRFVYLLIINFNPSRPLSALCTDRGICAGITGEIPEFALE